MYLYLNGWQCIRSAEQFLWGINAILHPIKLIVAKLHPRNCPGGCIIAHQRVNYKIFIYCLAVIIIAYGLH